MGRTASFLPTRLQTASQQTPTTALGVADSGVSSIPVHVTLKPYLLQFHSPLVTDSDLILYKIRLKQLYHYSECDYSHVICDFKRSWSVETSSKWLVVWSAIFWWLSRLSLPASGIGWGVSRNRCFANERCMCSALEKPTSKWLALGLFWCMVTELPLKNCFCFNKKVIEVTTAPLKSYF